jgi:LSD1 subclass zinc finger protein
MPLTAPCPSCRATLSYPPEYAGRQVRCGNCQNIVTTPGAAEAPPANPFAGVGAPARGPANGAPDPLDFGRAAEPEPAPSPFARGLFVWGNRLVFLGALGAALTVGVTAAVQMLAMDFQDQEAAVLDSWIQTRFPEAEWASKFVNFAILAVYGGCLFLLLSAGLALLGLCLSFFSARGTWVRWLLPPAGLGLGLATLVAVSLPFDLRWVFHHYAREPFDLTEELLSGMTLTVKVVVVGAAALALLAAGCFLLYQAGAARKLGRTLLGVNVLVLYAFLVVVAAGLWGFDLAVSAKAPPLPTDATTMDAWLAHRSLAALCNHVGLLVWIVAALVALAWFFVSGLLLNRAVPRRRRYRSG